VRVIGGICWLGCLVSELTVTEEERGELREAVKSIRAEWREKLSLASRVSPTSKLGKRAGVLMLDMDILDDRIAEAGGEENLVFIICAQVASGVTLTEWCEHYALQRGLVWALLSEKDEWMQRYYRALEGVADGYYGEVVKISDEQNEVTTESGKTFDPDVQRDKLRIDTRMKVASKYANGRFGDKPVGVAVQNNITIIHESN
jgi:hypothetical protein